MSKEIENLKSKNRESKMPEIEEKLYAQWNGMYLYTSA